MNALIFNNDIEAKFLPYSHPKAKHIREVLRVENGSTIFAGILNKNLYKTKIFETENGYKFSEEVEKLENPKRLNATVICAFARPQIAKRIMFECACFGVHRLVFYPANKGERDYLKSSLYARNEVLAQFIKGAEQACSSLVPEFECAQTLQEAIEKIPQNSVKITPDIYEATATFSGLISQKKSLPTAIVFGAERGFNNSERDLLRSNGFTLASLGERVLRTDTAIIATLALLANA